MQFSTTVFDASIWADGFTPSVLIFITETFQFQEMNLHRVTKMYIKKKAELYLFINRSVCGFPMHVYLYCDGSGRCPDNNSFKCVCADEDSEPIQKKLRLCTEEQRDSESPQFSVVTLPSEPFNISVSDSVSLFRCLCCLLLV